MGKLNKFDSVSFSSTNKIPFPFLFSSLWPSFLPLPPCGHFYLFEKWDSTSFSPIFPVRFFLKSFTIFHVLENETKLCIQQKDSQNEWISCFHKDSDFSKFDPQKNSISYIGTEKEHVVFFSLEKMYYFSARVKFWEVCKDSVLQSETRPLSL